jgi:hypothetical protein
VFQIESQLVATPLRRSLGPWLFELREAAGTSGPEPRFHERAFRGTEGDGDRSSPENWGDAFRTPTGQNIDVAVNGIAKLLRMMTEED